MQSEMRQKTLLGSLLFLLLALTGLLAFLALGHSGQDNIIPAPSPSPSKTYERNLVIPDYDPQLGKVFVAEGMYQVLGNKQLPDISGSAEVKFGKSKSVSAFQWAASFATMATYWPPLYQEPLKDDPKWLPGYFSDFIDHLDMEKRLQFGGWTENPQKIIQNMPEIGSLILVPAESMKFDYPAIAERGYGPAVVDIRTTEDGKTIFNVKFEFTSNMYFFKNGKRMVMGIMRNIDYDLIENPEDKKHPWLLSAWRPTTTYSTYSAKPEPKPNVTPSFNPEPAPAAASPSTTDTSPSKAPN